ncbi:asparagine synthase (glutamine-hydrolyzing) [Evansella vedderi]|uniref:asparagine synthase (glutamine-hydrolyzing) n=1 Tax=Evansella vedderi TaxID=38282 RepID=A0ABT9ZTA7_9BACI|nr:asparagine synthase C-terminal domain-containing protein [Evansella vedderi]MDQ0254467.1 asparagine synthase (glutamine-hydrolyzing) [Evansella vedderi]
MNISLKNKIGAKWRKKGSLFIKGIVNEDVELDQLVNLQVLNENAVKKLLQKQNTFFSLVCETDTLVFAAVDHLRSYPIFYSVENGNLYLSDDANWIRQQIQEKKINKLSESEFLMTGYVTGENTLYSKIKQLQAGEYLVYNRTDKTLNINNYYFKKREKVNSDKHNLINDLDQIHINVFKRLINNLNKRTVVLPLSGGYDSRIIAIMLKRLGYNNVVCFTYGKHGSWESTVSKEVADALNFKWIFIPYSKSKWREWSISKEREEYFNFASGLSSLPHVQDHLAVKELTSKRLIPEDSIFIPGHTAFLSFSGYDPTCNDIKHVANNLLNKHYSLWDWNGKRTDFKHQLNNKIFNSLFKNNDNNTFENLFYQWEVRERHAKFICNSVRAYEHFGYEWRIPLWEKEMVDFWMSVPQKYRVNKNLFKDYFNEKLSLSMPLVSSPNSDFLGRDVSRGFKLKQLIKKSKNSYMLLSKSRKVADYYKHPLDWYSMLTFYEYFTGIIRGAENINSFLSEKYISNIKSKQKEK